MDQGATDSILKTANRILLASQIFAVIFAIFSGTLGAVAIYFYVSYDDGTIATCAESLMEIDCSNVECAGDWTQFGDCQDENLIPSAILLIVTSLAEWCHFVWAWCCKDETCYDDWSTPLGKRKFQILSILVMRVLVVVVESFWVVIFANYEVIEPSCSCESTLYYYTYGTPVPYKNRVSNIVLFNTFYLVFVSIVFVFCIVEAIWYIVFWKQQKLIEIRHKIKQEKEQKKREKEKQKKDKDKEKEKEKGNHLDMKGLEVAGASVDNSESESGNVNDDNDEDEERDREKEREREKEEIKAAAKEVAKAVVESAFDQMGS